MPLAPSSVAQQSPGRLVAPAPATAAAPVITPAPVNARPQLERVSPEIFASEDAPAGSAAPVFTLNAAPPAEFRTAQSPVEALPPGPAAVPVDPQVAQTPLLILVPNPEPSQPLGTTPQAAAGRTAGGRRVSVRTVVRYLCRWLH